jgi:hypothetical protein
MSERLTAKQNELIQQELSKKEYAYFVYRALDAELVEMLEAKKVRAPKLGTMVTSWTILAEDKGLGFVDGTKATDFIKAQAAAGIPLISSVCDNLWNELRTKEGADLGSPNIRAHISQVLPAWSERLLALGEAEQRWVDVHEMGNLSIKDVGMNRTDEVLEAAIRNGGEEERKGQE